MSITAKVICRQKVTSGDGDTRQALVSFCPDYADGRNAEWSVFTPHLALDMTLRDAAADLFEQGAPYLLTFEREGAGADPAVAGRVAYAAYSKVTDGQTHDGRPMPAWEELGDTIQRAWIAAAGSAGPTPATR